MLLALVQHSERLDELAAAQVLKAPRTDAKQDNTKTSEYIMNFGSLENALNSHLHA